MMDDLKTKLPPLLTRFKYPLIVLIIGAMLMLMPDSSQSTSYTSQSDNTVSQVLSNAQGVGKACVLISDSGVIVVCEGADKAGVKLEIIRAIESYTGYGSDKITILKMAD